jgi:hypothetical protein
MRDLLDSQLLKPISIWRFSGGYHDQNSLMKSGANRSVLDYPVVQWFAWDSLLKVVVKSIVLQWTRHFAAAWQESTSTHVQFAEGSQFKLDCHAKPTWRGLCVVDKRESSDLSAYLSRIPWHEGNLRDRGTTLALA